MNYLLTIGGIEQQVPRHVYRAFQVLMNASLSHSQAVNAALCLDAAHLLNDTEGCTCGYGGFHEELNSRCELNQ